MRWALLFLFLVALFLELLLIFIIPDMIIDIPEGAGKTLVKLTPFFFACGMTAVLYQMNQNYSESIKSANISVSGKELGGMSEMTTKLEVEDGFLE